MFCRLQTSVAQLVAHKNRPSLSSPSMSSPAISVFPFEQHSDYLTSS